MRNLQLRVCESGEVMVNVIVGENDQEKIDALMGSNNVPASLAMTQVAAEAKVPLIALAPYSRCGFRSGRNQRI